jgi:hypothetical protein
MTGDEYIKQIVDAAPPFTPEQADRLALTLGPAFREARKAAKA